MRRYGDFSKPTCAFLVLQVHRLLVLLASNGSVGRLVPIDSCALTRLSRARREDTKATKGRSRSSRVLGASS